jgi:K+-sensing histidine kinase KdpD
MGLGLSLCRTVVEQHGGQLEFEALAPKGTVFRFTLPAATGQATRPKDPTEGHKHGIHLVVTKA